MRKISFAGTTLAFVAAAIASYAIAQTAPAVAPPASASAAGQAAPQRQQGGNGGDGGLAGSRPQTMDLASAQKMAAAVESAADDAGEQAAVCIMDTSGAIVVFERMDETNRIPVGTAEGKARAVLMFGIPTGDVASALRNPVPLQVTAPPIGGSGGVITIMRGGLPIYRGGKMIGAIGVGGADSKDAGDEQLAQIGIEAAGLSSKK